MNRLLKPAIVLGVFTILGICASPAPAAKGVKKNGEHHVQGRVVAVVPAKGGAKGTLIVHVTHQKHKKGTPIVIKKGADHTFTLDGMTQVHHLPKGVPAPQTALHKGEHVTVLAHQHHADKVAIHHVKKKGKVG
jgi:hypothetical protein